MSTFSYQRAHRAAIVLLCFLVVVCIVGLFLAGDLARFQQTISVADSQAALRDVTDPQQLERVLKQHSSNRVLKMVALANKDSIEIDAAAQRLLKEAEPRDLSKPVALTALGPGDLEALGRDLKIAESNAATIMPRYTALIKAGRDKLEHDARLLEAANTLTPFMSMIDEQHTDMTSLFSKVLAARVDYYGPYEKCVALLVQYSGVYKVVNGQFIFPSQSAADSYNAAAAAMTAAAKRIAELEGQRATLRQSQLGRWKDFVER